jgi:PAS domain-containing protein/predicted GTPase
MIDAADNLFQKEPVWQAFLPHTPECVLDVDFKTREIRCSTALAQSLRLTTETLPRTLDQWLELYHPDDYAASIEFRRRVFENADAAFSLERRLYCGDGVYRWFCVSVLCVRGKDGQIERLVALETDISPQKIRETENAARTRALEDELSLLKNEKERLATRLSQKTLQNDALERKIHLFSRMLDASSELLFHRDASGRVTVCNQALSNALACNPGLTAEDLTAGDLAAEARWSCRDAYGRTREFFVKTEPLSPEGTGGHVGAARDITEIEEARSDIDRLRRLLGRYALTSWEDEAPGCADEKIIESDAANLNFNLERYLKKAHRALSSAPNLFPTRAAQLENLIHSARGAELEVGVVGITSSGKSAFINAMMGEQLLPEETRATTNLVIRCRKGKDRSVAVTPKEGQRWSVTGPNLTAAWMENIASERLNPENEQDVAFLEWSGPGAALPEGLVLVDTPGLDACGFPEHSELVLRRLLPNLDIVLYVTSIRNRFKKADLELLEAALEQDQRVIFLLTQIDLEQDDMEGGKVVLSRSQKLSSYVSELYRDIDRYFPTDSCLRRSAVIAVSSKLAAAYFYDRDNQAWSASNFGTLIGQLEAYRSNLGRCRFETRARRALVLISRAASDVELALGKLSTEKARSEEAARLEKIKELRDAQRWANAEISAVRNEWRRQLDPDYHLRHLKKEIERANTVKGIKDSYERWGDEWAPLVTRMTDRMDRARRSCRDILRKHGIAPEERGAGAIAVRSELPAFYRYVVHEAREVRVRGWFEALEFWPRYSIFFKQNVDKKKMMDGAKELVAERLRLLNAHLSWWENRVREDHCDPLYAELSREEVALGDVRRAVSGVSVSRRTLLQVSRGLREAVTGIKDSLSSLEPGEDFAPKIYRDKEFFPTPTPTPQPAATLDQADAPDYGLFTPLVVSFQEQGIQTRFLELEALRQRRRVVLLGLRRHDSLRLLSRLAHDAAFFDALKTEEGREAGERDWIFHGSIPPALPHVRAGLPDTFLSGLDVLVAPSDGFYAPNSPANSDVDWNDLFAEWLPVVHIDIARIDSGLSDLARAPYAAALAHVDQWVAASGQGALFNARLTDLLTDVPERLELFAARRGYRGRAEWFVYENYDARYTDFMLWGRGMDAGSDDGSLLRKWLTSGHDFRFPFSEFRMRLAIEGAKRKAKRKAKRRAAAFAATPKKAALEEAAP